MPDNDGGTQQQQQQQPPANDDADYKRFKTFFGRALAEDDANRQKQPPAQQQQQPPQQQQQQPPAQGSLRDEIRRAIEDHDNDKERQNSVKGLSERLAALEQKQPRKRGWFSPLIG